MLSRVGSRTAINLIKPQYQSRSMAVVKNFRLPTMAEMPVPQGSWNHAYAAKQRKNNMVLLTGILAICGTLTFFTQSGVTDFGRGPAIGKNE